MFRRLDAFGRLLLEGVHHSNVGADLQRVDDPKGIAAVLEHDLHNATVEALQGLGVVRLAAFGCHREGA